MDEIQSFSGERVNDKKPHHQITDAERKIIEAERRREQVLLRPFVLRNLKLALRLRPVLAQIREGLGFSIGMTLEQYATWKQENSSGIRIATDSLLEEYKVPGYQMPIIDWIFDASDEEIAELKEYCRKPSGEAPAAYRLLFGAMRQFSSPIGTGWAEETGYKVATLTRDIDGSWQVWGDLRGLPGGSWRTLFKKSGDFVIRGNLDTFDIDSWRRIGRMLGTLKRAKGMGGKLGLVAGARRGKTQKKKIILRGMPWPELTQYVNDHPSEFNPLRNEYASMRLREYENEYRHYHGGTIPPEWEQLKVRYDAIRYFRTHLKKS